MDNNYNIWIPISISSVIVFFFSYAFLKNSEPSLYYLMYIGLIILSIFFMYDAWYNKDNNK